MSRGRFRNSRFHHPTLCRAHEKHAKFIVFPWVFSTSQKNIDFDTSDDERHRGYKHFSTIHLRVSMFFSWEINMFQGFRATAPQTCDRFRTSNGAADVLYVSWKVLTAPQTCSIFFSKGDFEFGGFELAVSKCSQKQRTTKTTADVQQVYRPGRFRRRRATKTKMDFSRWIFGNNKIVKIILVL